KVGYKDDLWVLAECVAQVFYVLDLADEKMHVVISGKQKIDVVVVATRRIMRPTKKGSTVQRPRTRTLTPVHDGILEDVVFPVEIMRKR
ncbi:hypothetical protein ACJX0J_022464, partial [Zea mays]